VKRLPPAPDPIWRNIPITLIIPINECNRLWLLKKGCVESEVGGYECRNQEEVLAS
jgi:hypothetical protein